MRLETKLSLIIAAAGAVALPLSVLASDAVLESGPWVATRAGVLLVLAASLVLARRDAGVERRAMELAAAGAVALGAGAFVHVAAFPLTYSGALLVVAGALVAIERSPGRAGGKSARSILDSLPDPACTVDASGTLLAANPLAEPIVADESLLDQIRGLAAQACAAESLGAKAEFDRKEPPFVALASARASADRTRVTVLMRDVTRERVSDQRRLDFLSNVSHELRTPLTSILGFSRLFQDGDLGALTEEQRDCINRIVTQGQYLLDLLNNLLDLSRLEAGRVKLETEPVDLGSIVGDVVSNLASLSAARGVDVRVRVPNGLPSADADRQKIVQVFINLISNAIKFCGEGGTIEVSAKLEGSKILACVSDTGIGIPEEEQARLFEKFYQGRAGRTGPVKGTGLGLAIVREIIRLHGGRIWVQSSIGHGTQFFFTLPCSSASASAPTTAPRAAPAPSRVVHALSAIEAKHTILVADDRPEILLLLRMKLGKVFRVVEARNGLEAVEAAEHNQPDLILMDIMMPVLDGTEATQRIKASPSTRHIPVYALTAKPTRSDHERLLEIGFAGVFTKPFDPQKLLDDVQRLVEKGPNRPPPAAV
ncbi:MAG: hybrid sensor histidine kinase/response regulator [Planctomycetes bacterium]|nr:hybrid sensor histidine kinase/response regulator [Planctomycetota bacterium]MBI3846588.1 hybrid sensor histidine kinase/response regulator [Planctomycetota bacterium]